MIGYVAYTFLKNYVSMKKKPINLSIFGIIY